MLLIPYFWDTTQFDKTRLGIFLSEGGNSLWNLDTVAHDSIIALLEDNDFPVTGLTYGNDIVYANIDYGQISLSDFYISTDPNVSEKDVWQIFDIPNTVLASEEFKSICQMLTGAVSNATVKTSPEGGNYVSI